MLLANPESIWLKGQRNHATVLFADVRQFTSYAEFKEPEEVVEALNGFFDIATRSIREYGGYIDKFIGDAILGVFGVPIQYDDHMEKALRASLDMQFKLHEASKKGNVLLKSVGIGINSGIVVSGNLGSQDKMEYTVIGDTVNLAARLSGLAGAGEIIISSNIRDQLTDMITVQDLPPQKIKGKKTMIEVFKVLNMRGMEQCNK